MFARRAAAEVAIDDENRRALIPRISRRVRRARLLHLQHVVFEKMLLEAFKRDRLQKTSGNDAIGVDVVAAHREGPPAHAFNLFNSHQKSVLTKAANVY